MERKNNAANTLLYENNKKPVTNKANNVVKQEITSVSILTEPLSLDKMSVNQKLTVRSITKNVKIVKKRNCNQTQRNTINIQKWKQNALTLFEFSYVYPFIHAFSKYKCFICAKAFLDPVLLKDHSTGCHNTKDFVQELNNRVRDKNIKVDVTYLQCKICETVCPNLYSLKVHLKEHGKPIDPEFQDNIIPYKLGGENFQCQICDTTFLKLRLLIIHMSKHFNNYSCETCGAGFISLHLLKRHLQTHKVGIYPCEICQKVFTNSSKKTMHIRGVHLKQFPRTCPICPERFNSNYQRTKHLRVVHNQSSGLFKCETCGREYDLKYQLRVHIRSVHLQERNQECGICNSRFFSKYCLSRHMVIHTGEKNFKCDICGKAYARRKNLKEHKKSHDIGHACSVCGREFNNHVSLVTHINNTHGVI